MPSYEATPEEIDQYGASLSIWEQIALLQAWAPMLAYGQRFLATSDPYARSIVVAEAAEWLASKTSSNIDNQAVKLLSDILRTPQGEAMVRWAVAAAEGKRA